jgi:hypothetical protein
MRLVIARSAPVAVLLLALYAAPAAAQRRADLPGRPAPVAVYDAGTGAPAGGLLDPSAFRFSHSYEFSYSGFGGEGLGLGMYTTSLRWQPTDRLAARVDVGVAHSPFGSEGVQQALGFDGDTPARVFLRNAEIAYRPTENTVLHLQVRQSPFGAYAAPYGYGYSPGYSPYGHAPYGLGSEVRATFAPADDGELFWRGGR